MQNTYTNRNNGTVNPHVFIVQILQLPMLGQSLLQHILILCKPIISVWSLG